MVRCPKTPSPQLCSLDNTAFSVAVKVIMTCGRWGRDSMIVEAGTVWRDSLQLVPRSWGRDSQKQNNSKSNFQPLIREAVLTIAVPFTILLLIL